MTSSFRVILGLLMVSLQFEPADARVLVEHPDPRCPSCTPVLFGVHVNSPPPLLCVLRLRRCVGGGVKIGLLLFGSF